MTDPRLHGCTIHLETLHGSRAYGLQRPSSDWDYKGILVGPSSWYFGFRPSPEQIELGPDHVLFDIRKFFRLAAEGNPTIIEILYTQKNDRRICTDQGEYLIEARDQFLSKKVAQSFGGYALSQLKRIKTHRRWLLSPPSSPPNRSDFGLNMSERMSKEEYGAAEALIKDDALPSNITGLMNLLGKERAWRSARREWEQFQSWKKNRNPVRASLEAKYGYDTKHALHLIRLMRMGVEILENKEVIVKRHDYEELISIRNGAWSYEYLIENAENLQLRIKNAEKTSDLPLKPDYDALEELCTKIIEESLTK